MAELQSIEANGLGLCNQLFAFISQNAESLEAGEAEMEILHRVRAIGQQAMAFYFKNKGTGDVGEFLEDDDGTMYYRETRDYPRTYFSLFGKVKMRRVGYRHRGQPALFPLDAQANLPAKQYSYPLRELVADFSLGNPFREGMKLVKKWLGQPVWDHSAEIICRESSQDYDAFYKDRPPPSPAPEGDILVASFDGKGVPMIKKEAAKIKPKLKKGEKRQKKKEAIIGVCYTVEPKIRTAEEIAKRLIYEKPAEEQTEDRKRKESDPVARDIRRVASIVKPKQEVFETIRAEVEARDPEKDHVLAVLVDGDPALERRAKKTFKSWPGFFLVLDIIHVLSYLWSAAHAFHGEGSTEAQSFTYERLVQILKGRVGYVIGGLKSMKTKRKLKGGQADAVEECIRYFKNHRRMMKYDKYLDWGLPIATGVVESACNSIVKNRMEGCGMRWSIEGAESMLRLRSVYLSQDWEAYWKDQVGRKREELHGRVLRIMPQEMSA